MGRGCGAGRALGVGVGLTVAVGVGVTVGVAVGVGVGVDSVVLRIDPSSPTTVPLLASVKETANKEEAVLLV